MSYSEVFYEDFLKKNHYLSAELLEEKNKEYSCFSKLADFVELSQKGIEPGSASYTEDKRFKFIRTSDISKDSLLINEKSCIGIKKKFFENHNLKKGQILIVKDAGLGKVAILNQDYPNFMLCAGIYALSCKHPFYVLAILQHPLFQENFYQNVARGSVFSHAGSSFLDFDIPLPNNKNKDIINYIENLMESIIYKENLINKKISYLNDYISNIIGFKGFENIKKNFPTFDDIQNIKRLDSGYYTPKARFIIDLIKSYEEGYFFIDKNNLKGGNTPKNRLEPINNSSLKYKWITPTYINDNGLINEIYSIEFDSKNNISSDACLIVNRTSKKDDGESGKFVAISFFYNYSFFGEGHHNQGIYRVENYDKVDLLVLIALLNHPLYREYFGEISLGSKMKEVKTYNLLNIPFPKFNAEIKNKIKDLYFNEIEFEFKNWNNDNFLDYDKHWSNNAGIYDLYLVLLKEKNLMNSVIEDIYQGKDIEMSYKF